MFENVDGRTDARVTGILIAHLGAFGSGELITIHAHSDLLLNISLAGGQWLKTYAAISNVHLFRVWNR